jgi:hypothetical protein
MLLKIYWSRNIPLKDNELSVSESDNVRRPHPKFKCFCKNVFLNLYFSAGKVKTALPSVKILQTPDSLNSFFLLRVCREKKNFQWRAVLIGSLDDRFYSVYWGD